MQLDLIVDNARIRTGDPARPHARRVGVWRGLVVGVDEELDGLTARERLDARGRTVVAGFNDAHAHSVWFGQSMLDVDLEHATSTEEVYRLVRARADELIPGAWVTCTGYDPGHLTGPEPDRDGLDAAANGRPVLIRHNTGHAFTVSGAVLYMAGISEQVMQQPEGGHIHVDEHDRPTGLLEETAMSLVQPLLHPESHEHIGECLQRASAEYAAEGITSVTDAGIAGGWIGHSTLEFGAYQRARAQGLLKTRFQTMVTLDALHPVEGHTDDGAQVTLDAGVRTGVGDEWLQIGPTKVFTDGAMLGATAAMTQDYCHGPHGSGYLQGDPGEMRRASLAAAGAGWSLAMHAIGDAALDFSLDVIEEARERFGRPAMPHRVEHGGVVRDDQIERMAALGVVMATQPNFISAFGDSVEERIGAARVPLSYPAGRLLRAGLVLPGSSDRPVAGGRPLNVVQDFVLRRTETGRVYGREDRITVEQALHAYTVGSAEATGWGGRKGRLVAGQLADFAVLSEDPREVPSEEIADIEVVATAVGGEFVHGGL
ncbi:amidohydrolase [Micrococcus sp. EYE_162]|uniref:amidohydrolase n=1 Tax=unclassified Micrococcus TaxID=2620948 RepID=UPI00200581EB|nr:MULTISPECIES: amidohydrolase [unclassified Micrococcus]MCK6095105.1 amidohydrolase [Micrococcus sp. EYE_212]MCK6171052.1 amidohydrolase [Micrococcus sp. EYE_162]